VLRDFSSLSLKKSKTLLSNYTFEGLLDLESLSRLIIEKSLDENISSRGFRFLSHLSINEKESSILVDAFGNLDKIFSLSAEEIDNVIKGRGDSIKDQVANLREQILSGKVIN
jgi:DNA integrity scanning protein DisA with diadenylate cyclase activity